MKWLMEWAVTSSALILIMLAVRFLFQKKLSARLKYALWAVVLVRLLTPLQLELPAAVSDALPLMASNLMPESPAALERPLSPETAIGYASFPPEEMEASGFHVRDDGTIVGNYPSWYPVADPETGGVRAYFGGPTLGDALQVLWIIGTELMTLALAGCNLHFCSTLQQRRKRLGNVDAPVRVYTVEGLSSPCLFGLLRPAVYVTPEAAENPDTLRHVLAHELTHRTHGDHIWSLLRCLVLVLHWYNPLVWLAALLSKADGELACDEGAVVRLGEAERIAYGRTLVDMVAQQSAHPTDLLSCSTSMTGGQKSIQRRVVRLLHQPETVKAALFAAVIVAVLAVVFVFAGRGGVPAVPEALDGFLAKTEAAGSIFVSQPSYYSTLTGGPISLSEYLTPAKELLTAARPVTELEEAIPSEELEKLPYIGVYGVSLYPTPEQNLDEGDRYFLFRYDGQCILFQCDEEERDCFQLLAYYSFDLIDALSELAQQQRAKLPWPISAYDQYHNRLASAQGIYHSGPMLHGGQSITAPDLLEEARELLVLTPIPLDEPVEWDGENWVCTLSVSVKSPDPDWTFEDWMEEGNDYALVSADDGTYICSGSNGTGGFYLGTISDMERLWELFQIQEERSGTGPGYWTGNQEAGNAFQSVLLGEHPFQFVAGDGSLQSMDVSAVPALFSPDSSYAAVADFALVDLDGDAIQEVVLHTSDVGNDLSGYLILRWNDGQICGYPSDWRTFWNLKTDGTFDYSLWSGSEDGVAGIRFSQTGYEMERLLQAQGSQGEFDTFRIGGHTVTEEEYQAARERQNEKNDALWFAFSRSNVRIAF